MVHFFFNRCGYKVFLGCLFLGMHVFMQSVPQFKPIALQEVLSKHPEIGYQKCCDAMSFSFEPFPLSYRADGQPCQGVFEELFILDIPQGQVCCADGYVVVDDALIEELTWKDYTSGAYKFDKISFGELHYQSGRVAVLAQRGCDCYYHWFGEVLGRLALLEMHNVAYDWLYVPCHKPYMKATLELWGIDMERVIDTTGKTHYVQAERLIVPSLVANVQGPYTNYSSYNHPYVFEYVKNKLLSRALALDIDTSAFSKKIFISRQDAEKSRKVVNEDQVFSLFKRYGFERYALSTKSIAEQVLLFFQAKEVVGFHGAGLVNLMFCGPGVEFVEIFQARGDSTYWYMAQMLHLKPQCIQTMPFSSGQGTRDTKIDIEVVQKALGDWLSER